MGILHNSLELFFAVGIFLFEQVLAEVLDAFNYVPPLIVFDVFTYEISYPSKHLIVGF